MHDELLRRLNETKTMSIVGMCKNAGKTTMLNWLLTSDHLRGTLGLTSIGRDGESTDVVTGTEKPGIFVKEGTLIATAKDMLRLGDVTKEILMTTGIPTPLGEVVILRARSAGYVQLAGPSITTQLKSVSQSFFELGADRSIVSNIAGTTRDAIDTVVERDGKHYRMVDTAGIRKKSTVYENIEYYSMVRGLRAIDRADVALLVVDASVGVTEQDQKVMGLAIERGCAIVVLLNKWDLLDDDRKREACMETVDRRLGVMAPWAQYLRISALTGRGIEKIWAMVDAAEKTRSQKITTSRLNTFLTDLREFGHTVVDGKRRLRMHYVTQTGVNPPTFTFFVNHSDLVNDTYQRYVENRMRSTFDFSGTPIRLFFRKKEQKDA